MLTQTRKYDSDVGVTPGKRLADAATELMDTFGLSTEQVDLDEEAGVVMVERRFDGVERHVVRDTAEAHRIDVTFGTDTARFTP